MRELVDAGRVLALMRALGAEARTETRAYLTGGSSAVLVGWRGTTVDVDLKFEPEDDRVLRAIPALKETLRMNLELASPGDFIPELPGWRERSVFIAQEGRITFLHYDFYAQTLSKIERSHARDLGDVREMIARNLVAPERLLELFAAIEPELYRYPALDPRGFRARVASVAAGSR
ncbi:MAG: DUF6036 family nucleotidyltransferase [Thermoanaerobaculia bacterium]